MDGIPWYLVNGEKYAQVGIKFDSTSAKDVTALGISAPPPCSEEHVCLLYRRAAMNQQVRSKQIKIEQLYGEPPLFLDYNRR